MRQKPSDLLNKNYGVLFLSLFLLMILLFAAEILLRIEPVAEKLNVPYLGSSHRQLEVQFSRIKLIAEQEGKIDCLFVGNSMVWLGINPEEFTNELDAIIHRKIDIYESSINEGIKAGLLRNINARMLAIIVLAILEYSPDYLASLHGDGFDSNQIYEDVKDIFLYGVLK